MPIPNHNTILAYPNYADADPAFAKVEVSGGAWLPAFPARNVLNPRLVRRARSLNATLASTKLLVDLGTQRDVKVGALPFVIASRNCEIRLSGYADAALTVQVCTSGWKPLYPVIYPFGSLYYGHVSFWDGKMSEEDAAIFKMPWLHVWEDVQVARYWLFEINDVTSELGYVEIPRVFLSPGYQPSLNFVFGAGHVVEPRTTVQESWGGAEFFDVQQGRRVARFSFDFLPEDEALVWVHDMQTRLGIHGQLLFVFDPMDTAHLHRRTFLARHRTLSPLEYTQYLCNGVTMEVAEVIA